MTEEKLKALLHSLTVAEKVGQLVQVPGSELHADGQELGVRDSLGIREEVRRNVGSTLNVLGADQVRRVQEDYLKQSRHQIPLLFMADIIYGFRTAYPAPIALGGCFEPELLRKICVEVSKESVASGAHVTFAPMADLVRDARWGRCLESTGEDPWMNSLYTAAMVEGFQEGLSRSGEPRGMASCVKHFAAYGAAEAGRDYNTVELSERRLRQDYLPSYRAGVKAGCEMVMTSFNIVDGIPSTANRFLLEQVLRREWGFDGVIITDYGAIAELVAHGVAKDKKEAALLAMQAGVDIDMCSDCYANFLEELLTEGKITMEQLDRAVLRVLRLKNKLGLFEDPFRGCSARAEAQLPVESFEALSKEAAVKSMVLLKNQAEALPLRTEALSSLALIGPYARNQDALGMWAVHAPRKRVTTLETALGGMLGTDRVETLEGCELLSREDYTDLDSWYQETGHTPWEIARREEELARALEAAGRADVVVAALGEAEAQSGEGGSRTKLTLPRRQLELLRRLRPCAKKLVTVVYAGRPLLLEEVEALSDAVLLVWYPGTRGSQAVCDVLFGKEEPGGRLAVSLPRSVGQLPLYYNAFSTGRPYDGSTPIRFFSRYTDCENTPLHPYGYGLSYHRAVYGSTKADSLRLTQGGTLRVRALVTNESDRPGTEVAQLYLQDVTGSVVRPVQELKGACRVLFGPGETREVSFTITEEMLRFYRKDMRFASEPGQFRVVIAPHSGCPMTESFELIEPATF